MYFKYILVYFLLGDDNNKTCFLCLKSAFRNICCTHLCFFGPTVYCITTHSPHISIPQPVFTP